MKLLLVSANRLQTPYPVYPLGIDLVAGAVSTRHTVEILDLGAAGEVGPEEGLRDAVHAFDPGCVGFSLRNLDTSDATDPRSFIAEYRGLVHAVRLATPAPIVLGGAAYSLFPRELLAVLGAEFGLAGEGERLLPLLDALERGEVPNELPGLFTPRTRGHADPPPPFGGALRREFRPSAPHLPHYLRHGGMLNLQSKRGCPFRCVYCTYPRIEGHALRPHPPEEVAREAKELEAAGARFLWFTDASFNCDVDHGLAVAHAMRRARVAVPWGAFFTPLAPTPGFYAELADSGLTHVELGTESLSTTTLRGLRKPFAPEEVRAAHADARAAGLHVAHYFLLGGPGETRATLDETLEAAERLEGAVLFFFCGVRVYPGTELAAIAAREGSRSTAPPTLLEPTFYVPVGLEGIDLAALLGERAAGRRHWVTAAGGASARLAVSRLHARGRAGPLWELLAPR
jgi:hypothetical protein